MPLSLFNQKQSSPLGAGGCYSTMELQESKPKSFWNRPEGTTGMLFCGRCIIGWRIFAIPSIAISDNFGIKYTLFSRFADCFGGSNLHDSRPQNAKFDFLYL